MEGDNVLVRSDGRRCRTCTQTKDREAKHRKTKKYQASHCQRGHEFTPENTGMNHGFRYCRVCFRARKANQRAKTNTLLPLPPLKSANDIPDVRWMPLCPDCKGFGWTHRGGGPLTRCTAHKCVGGYRFDLVGADT